MTTPLMTPSREALEMAIRDLRFPACEHRINEKCSPCLTDALLASGVVKVLPS